MKKLSKERIFHIIQIGTVSDFSSRAFDIFVAVTICLNLFALLFETFEQSAPYRDVLRGIETVTVILFTIEYALRLWTAEYLYPEKSRPRAVLAFVFSFFGIVDLLTILPFYFPFIFPTGMVAFRMIRVVRIFHLLKINKYYDSFSVITEVLREKRGQIISSVFIILILMLASSLCIYQLEHEAQPDKFSNAFSGIWWSVSTLLTVGYGDIYPITPLGQIMGIVTAFLGVGMVAIPTGIISAGFVEHYSRIKSMAEYGDETSLRFVALKLTKTHSFCGHYIKDVRIPEGLIVALIIRNGETILPKGDVLLQEDDKVVLAAEAFKDDIGIKLREIVVKEENPWVNTKLRDLDISRQTLIVAMRRRGKIIIPNGNTTIKAGDILTVYSKHRLSGDESCVAL